MRKSIILLIHAAFWLGNLALLLLILTVLRQSGALEESEGIFFFKIAIAVVAVPGILSFYSFYLFLFPNFLNQKNITKSVIIGLGICMLCIIPALIALYLLMDFVLSCYKESDYIIYPIIVVVSLVYGAFATVIRGFITWYEDIKIKETLQEKNHKMELALVKSQLDPHFLFNTINNIDILILKDQEKASNYLNKLSDIMRFMLFETKVDQIPLQMELEYINKYIELQKIRTSNQSYVNYSVVGAAKNKKIAPMVFIPFIENAFKHVSNKKLKNAIQVEILIENDCISFQCENRFDLHRSRIEKDSGMGNDLIQKRLNLLYPDQHELEMGPKDEHYFVKLKIYDDKV